MFELLSFAQNELQTAGIENSKFEAMCMLEDCFSVSKTDYYLNKTEPLNDADKLKIEKLKLMITKRKNHEPLQYILGKWDFYKSSFYVGEGVLIPRPETEILVEIAISGIKKSKAKVCFDLCAGSGCIGLSIAKECPETEVYLFEKYKEAMYYLEKNAKAFNLPNVHILSYDVFDGFNKKVLPNPDIIVSNPPYITSQEMLELQAEVLLEPKTALDGGDDGLMFYRAIAELWGDKIKKPHQFLFEVGEKQAFLVQDIFRNKAYDIKLIKDIKNILRFVIAKKTQNNM